MEGVGIDGIDGENRKQRRLKGGSRKALCDDLRGLRNVPTPWGSSWIWAQIKPRTDQEPLPFSALGSNVDATSGAGNAVKFLPQDRLPKKKKRFAGTSAVACESISWVGDGFEFG